LTAHPAAGAALGVPGDGASDVVGEGVAATVVVAVTVVVGGASGVLSEHAGMARAVAVVAAAIRASLVIFMVWFLC
jgi:hypothetical protein